MYLAAGGSIPISELDESVVEMYTHDVRAKCEENFLTLRYRYRTHKIETLLLEGDNPALALLRYISDSGATSLVLGSCSSNYFSRTPKDSELPSIVLKHAPDTCKIYVVSANKIISNSLNPMSASGRDCDSCSFTFSSSSSESKYQNCLSNVSQVHSHSRTLTFSSVNSDGVEETFHQVSEESAYSKQSETQTEIEQLRLELENTLTMYNLACENLVHAQSKVHLLSSECIQEAQRVNAAQEREENLRRIAALEREKYLEAEEEAEMAKKLLAKETYERQIAELMVQKVTLETNKIVDALMSGDQRYRRYTRDDIHKATCSFEENKLIGEGAYGKVYKCSLDHTLVAIKTLRPDAFD
ncbi:hypothetical protein C2S52_019084 [Perilla frutescens var. hirtella]|nr:hypothetical protein C2S52_019084 [Perilla frutescens var. hirtella]